MTFAEYIVEVMATKVETGWRLGQTYFNVLCSVRPDISEEVRGDVQFDPFYQDKRINDFLGFVASRWDA